MQKDFYKITDLTKEVEKAKERFDKDLEEEMTTNKRNEWHLWLLYAQLQAQMAIAQQLAMLAQGVRTIADAVERESKKADSAS